MATLQGRAIKDTYKDLLQVSNSNAGVDATLRTVEDGEGTSSALQVSTGGVQVNGTSTLKSNSGHTATDSVTKEMDRGDFIGSTATIYGNENFQGCVYDNSGTIQLDTAGVDSAQHQFHAKFNGNTTDGCNVLSATGKGIASAMFINNVGTYANDGALQTSLAMRSADTATPAGQGASLDLQTPYKRINFGLVYKGQAGVYIQNVDDRNTTAMGFYPNFGAGTADPADPSKTIVGLELGTSSFKWKQLYASTATIATSDENTKTQIESLSEAEKNVAVALKGLVKKFKFKSAVAVKGENARLHIGLIAQEVEAAFSAEGLNASDYSLFCVEKWYECTDSEGKVQNSPIELPNHECVEKTQLGLRYEEILSFIISAL